MNTQKYNCCGSFVGYIVGPSNVGTAVVPHPPIFHIIIGALGDAFIMLIIMFLYNNWWGVVVVITIGWCVGNFCASDTVFIWLCCVWLGDEINGTM